MDDHGVAVRDHFVEAFGTACVQFDDLGMHIVGHCVDQMNGSAAASHDKDIGHVGVFFLSGDVADIVDVFWRGHEIDDVEFLETVGTVGNEGFSVALDGHDMVWRICTAEVLEGDVEDMGCPAHFHAEEDERTVLHFPPLADPAALDVMENFLSCEHFRIDDGVDTHRAEELAVLGERVLIVVDSGHGFPGAQLGGQHAAGHVVGFVGGDADEEVRFSHFGFLQG